MKQNNSTLIIISFLIGTVLFVNSSKAQLPNPSLVGYWQNYNDPNAPYMPLTSIDARYNVIEVSFAVPHAGTDYQMEFIPTGTTQAGLITEIQTLQSQGRKVLISMGGASAPVSLSNTSEKNIFISTMNSILDTYGFDGIDIDFEGSSLNISGGTITAPVDAPIINLIDAIKQIMQHRRTMNGTKLLLTMAPETVFVQGAMSSYGADRGAYLPVIHALRDSIDLLQVQLYNSGTVYGIDGNIYSQETADFIIAMTEAVIRGFNTGGGMFAGLPASKVGVGLPACTGAAPGGGYTTPAIVRSAMNYLLGTGPKPGTYTLQQAGGYPSLRGMMTWSVNWDAVSNCGALYEYAANFQTIFGGNTGTTSNELPNPALVGYWQNWNDPNSPYIPLTSIDSRYNVIEVSFAVPHAGTDYQMEFIPTGTTQAGLITEIQTLQSQGRKVLISMGGASAPVSLSNTSEKNTFISTMNAILDTYGFDGIDIDFEGSSLNISGGTITAPVDAPIINLIDAIKQIMQHRRSVNGTKLLLTMAPETVFVQGAMSSYGADRGAYLPVIHALRDSIDQLQVQLYNSGTVYGIDGNIYAQETADFIIAMTEAVIRGFNTGGGMFTGLPASKVGVGLPACTGAAPGGGYTTPAIVRSAMNYLLGTGPKPGTYTLQQAGGYPSLRGMMTWSVNWDVVSNCGGVYEYAANFETIFGPNTWTGIVNNAWENAGNWSRGFVPNNTTDVLINSGTVIVNSNAFCKSIKVSSTAHITVNTGFTFTVTH